MAKIRYKLVNSEGDVINATAIRYDVRYPVRLTHVEIIQAGRGETEEVLELTLEYLHGIQRKGYPPLKQTYCTNCGHKLPE